METELPTCNLGDGNQCKFPVSQFCTGAKVCQFHCSCAKFAAIKENKRKYRKNNLKKIREKEVAYYQKHREIINFRRRVGDKKKLSQLSTVSNT
jgi:hypothetical protein